MKVLNGDRSGTVSIATLCYQLVDAGSRLFFNTRIYQVVDVCTVPAEVTQPVPWCLAQKLAPFARGILLDFIPSQDVIPGMLRRDVLQRT